MSNEDTLEISRLVSESVVRTTWDQIAALQKRTARDLRVVEPKAVENPFTGEVASTSQPSKPALQLREMIQQSSLKDDERFLPLLDEVIRSSVMDVVWGLFVAFDGSGDFLDGREIGLYDHETEQPIDTFMHEIFYDFDPRNQRGET